MVAVAAVAAEGAVAVVAVVAVASKILPRAVTGSGVEHKLGNGKKGRREAS